MPTTFHEGKRTRSLKELLDRNTAEVQILESLAENDLGLGFGEIEALVPRNDLGSILRDLVDSFHVRRWEGGFYGITSAGRKRLAPAAPKCVHA